MAETRKISKSKQSLKPKFRVVQPSRAQNGLTNQAELSEEVVRMAGHGHPAGQVTQLNNPNLQTAQRHALATHLGHVQGNRGLQNALIFPGANLKIAQRQGAVPAEGDPSAPALAGTSIHPTIRQGSNGPAVEELQEKLNADGATPPLVVDGIFGPLTRGAAVAFQTKYGLDPDGIVGPLTWGQIDTLGLASSVGRVEKEWEENVGGQTYGMTSRYTWRIVNDEIRVTVKLKFTGLKNPGLVERWFSYIRGIWNRFVAINEAGEEIAIVFDPQSVTSEPDNVVEIKPGNGRSDAANWYAEDPDSDNTAAHEFGHMIGLEDEYQRAHADYKRLTGEDPDSGATTNPADPGVIANELNAALMQDDEADRVQQANDVVTNHGLVQGDFAQEVAAAYLLAFGVNLVDHIVTQIPDEDEWDIVDPFTHSSGSMMGINTNHEHPVEPRHVREFIGHIAAFKGGNWKAEER